MARHRPIHVGHFRTPFLSISETFIYSFLIHATPRIRSFVFTSERANEDAFPFARVIRYPMPRFTSAIWNVGNQVWRPHEVFLRRAFKRYGIAVLHAHFGPEGWALIGLSQRLNLPIVTTFYGYDASYVPTQPAWRQRYRQLFKAGDLFLAEGPQLKARLESLGCPSSKIQIQPIAVDVEGIPWRIRCPRRQDARVFLFCGRFIEKKGLIHALRAFRRLLDRGCRAFEFRVIGDGDEMTNIRHFVAEEGLAEYVKFRGVVSHAQFCRELYEADVFVAPSVTASNGDTEGGAPTTILEAQAAGLPIVTTRHADIPSVVSEGETALLAPERDEAALADHLQFFIEHPEALATFGRNGRRFVERRHNIAIEKRRIAARYAEVVSARSS
jgi:colanic acid/amylovoran biosynthesis glycosyltransferase